MYMQRYKKNFIINKNKSINYEFRKQDITSYNNRQTIVSDIRKRYFASIKILPGKLDRTVTRDKIILRGFYYIPKGKKNKFKKLKIRIRKYKKLKKFFINKNKTVKIINENQINNLGLILTRIYNRPVELHLTKLKYPYIDRYILAQYVRLLTQKFKFKRIKKILFRNIPLTNNEIRYNNNNIISYITGLKLEISGRLITERARPRQTVSTAKIGSFNRANKKTCIDYRSYTFKNAKGALTAKIWLNQQIVVTKN